MLLLLSTHGRKDTLAGMFPRRVRGSFSYDNLGLTEQYNRASFPLYIVTGVPDLLLPAFSSANT